MFSLMPLPPVPFRVLARTFHHCNPILLLRFANPLPIFLCDDFPRAVPNAMLHRIFPTAKDNSARTRLDSDYYIFTDFRLVITIRNSQQLYTLRLTINVPTGACLSVYPPEYTGFVRSSLPISEDRQSHALTHCCRSREL